MISKNREIQIKTYKVDWLKVIELALNREKWGATYTLYSINNVNIKCTLETFNFTQNKATFKIWIDYIFDNNVYDKSTIFNCETVGYYMENFSLKQFNTYINKKIISLLQYVTCRATSRKAESLYNNLYQYSWNLKVEKEAKKLNLYNTFLTLNKIENDDIKNDSIYTFKESLRKILNKKYHKNVDDYCKNHKVKIKGFNTIIKLLETEIEKEKIDDEEK